MADSWLLAHTAIAIVGIVVIITLLRVPPVFALLIGAVYLGLATGLGAEVTTEALSAGFGEVMIEIGLLIIFGVLLGSLMAETNTLQRVIEGLTRGLGVRRLPMIFSVSLSTMFTSIYADVLLVLTAPLARRLGPQLGRNGTALMGGALTAGIEVGLVFVVPGVGALAVAGLLGVPLGEMFLLGLVVGVPTAVLTMAVFAVLLRRVLRWDPDVDELEPTPDTDDLGGAGGRTGAGGTAPVTVDAQADVRARQVPILLALSPVLIALVLIALGAIAGAAELELGVVGFLGDPVVAMFLGAAAAYLLAIRTIPAAQVASAVGRSLAASGPILVLSGLSGSLAAVIGQIGLDDVLAGYFSSSVLPPLLLVWVVAAILHIALGSISLSAITAAGILAPIADSLGVPVVLIALAAGSGALFVPHVSSNFFWMFQTLFGFSTRGTFKTHSVAMTLSSLISLPIVLALDLVV